jgi:hypothetical protein
MAMKNSNDATGNLTDDHPGCIAVPRPTAPQIKGVGLISYRYSFLFHFMYRFSVACVIFDGIENFDLSFKKCKLYIIRINNKFSAAN